MIRRLGAAILFAILGFASFLIVVNSLLEWVCGRFKSYCPINTGQCPGIDVCIESFWHAAFVFAVWLGPALVFATTAFIFSKRRRPFGAWITLAIGLAVAHSMVMLLATPFLEFPLGSVAHSRVAPKSEANFSTRFNSLNVFPLAAFQSVPPTNIRRPSPQVSKQGRRENDHLWESRLPDQ